MLIYEKVIDNLLQRGMASLSTVDLGFFESDYEPWELESRHFPSKVGSKPAWLDMKHLPSFDTMKCPQCEEPRHFLLQVYAPDNNVSEAFHRTIFIFLCTRDQCWAGDTPPILVLRSQLPRDNAYYPHEPPQNNAHWRSDLVLGDLCPVCAVCGARGDMRCGGCRSVSYCGPQHQRLDWRAGHKQQCKHGDKKKSSNTAWCLTQGLLDMEEEPDSDVNDNSNDKYKSIVEEATKNGVSAGVEASNEEWDEIDKGQKEDKVMEKFKSRLRRAPDQVIRYERRGAPLLCCDTPLPPPPPCQQCGGERSLEFQVMPQLLSELKLGSDTCAREGLDWASLYVYTCDSSCHVEQGYVREHVQLLNYNLTNLPETEGGKIHQEMLDKRFS